MKQLIWPLAFLGLGAHSGIQNAVGTLGTVRYSLADNSLKERAQDSSLLALSQGVAEFTAPLNSWEELDRLALLSHKATNLCGSIDYFPLGYTLAETQSHSPSYFSAEASFPVLESIIAQADLDKINQTLTTLTSMPSRFHRHPTGQNAGQTVATLWQNEIVAGNDSSWTISQTSHTATPQKSVIAHLPGESSETIILGAHLDSINSEDGPDAISPGADDDASGVAILTEILRIVEANNMRFHKTIEIQAYAAEEIGLVGSRALASEYKNSGKNIGGMLQFDMAYYSQGSDAGKIFFLENFTSLDLTRNAIHWMKRYIGNDYTRGFLPFGSSSDHRSWWEQGYPTLFPFENPDDHNRHIHTAEDEMDKFDDGVRMKRLVQLGLLFLAYQAGLKDLDSEAAAANEKIRTTMVAKDVYLNISGSNGSYAFAASGAATAAYLEFCRIESAADFRCHGNRRRLAIASDVGDRQTFTGEANFAKGEMHRIEVYNSTDELLARRHIVFE